MMPLKLINVIKSGLVCTAKHIDGISHMIAVLLVAAVVRACTQTARADIGDQLFKLLLPSFQRCSPVWNPLSQLQKGSCTDFEIVIRA